MVRHAPKTGVPLGVHCKNVELGVLFHSTPRRAYYVEPVPGCGCGSGCRCSDPDLEARPSVATASTKRSGKEERDGPRQRSTSLLYVPLPVPFRLDSEPYSNPDAGSPDLRFLPYMHILKEFPRWPVGKRGERDDVGPIWGRYGGGVGSTLGTVLCKFSLVAPRSRIPAYRQRLFYRNIKYCYVFFVTSERA